MKPEKKIHPIVRGAVSGAAFIFASFLANFVLPAWAVLFPVGNLFVVDLGALTPWIGIIVTIFIWWDARQAKKHSHQAEKKAAEAAASAAAGAAKIETVSVQIDGLLADRDKANKKIGKDEEKQAGAEVAAALAQGQSEGRDNERDSVAAKSAPANNGPLAAAQDAPVPVVDDVAGGAAVKSAAALESLASSAKKTAEDK